MGNRYVIQRQNHTPTAGNDSITVISASARRVRVIEAVVNGMGTSSAAQCLLIGRSTAGTTGGGAITPDKFDHSDQPAMSSVVDTTWSVQPTLGTNTHTLAFNALGGCAIWKAPGGRAYEARNGENISVRAASAGITYQPCAITLVVEED